MNHGYISRYLAIALASALVLVACGGGSDTPRTAAPAGARARDASAAGAAAAPAAFGGGARWIWNATDTLDEWVALRKTFKLGAVPSSAVTTISVDTHYWLYVNGTLVTFEGGLKRGPNPNDSYYDSKDIAPYLHSGKNTIAVLAWHLGKTGSSHKDSGASGLLLESDIVTGATTTVVASDASWKQKVFPGYVHDTSGMQPNGGLAEWNVSYDARNAASMANWTAVAYDDSAWPAAVDKGAPGVAPWNALVPRTIPPYRFSGLQAYTNAASLPTSGSGADIVATLPSNIQVTPYLKVDAPAGLTIRMQTDHYLDGGNGTDANVRSTYVTTGGVQEFESLGWMSGTTVIYNVPAGVTILGLKYRESGYDTDFAGSFSSNDPFFDKLWQKSVRTIYLNMRDTYMDCPTRERNPWWGDATVDIRGAAYVFDSRADALTDKGIRQLVGWQKSNSVLFSPYPGNGGELPTQMLASIAELADFYLQSGDASALDGATYAAVKAYMNLWTMDAQGLVNHRAGDWDWEDWGANIDARVLDNAWYYKALASTITLANLTGNGADVPAWQSRKDSIAAHFDGVLWNTANHEYRSPGYTADTDDRANALAVAAGLAKAENYPAILNVLQTHQNASPYMETYAIEALYKMGHAADAQARMVSRYTTEVNDPGYTLWELWQKGGWGTDNHGWNGAPLMLSIYGAGARATAPGWQTWELLPQPGKLTQVNAVVPTPKGKLSLNLDTSTPTRVTMKAVAPAGTTGRIGVPKLAGDPTVSANGTVVFKHGAATGSVAGLGYLGNDDGYVYFSAAPGTWKFVATGTAIVAPPPPPGWNFCVFESGTCAFSGTATVRYGAGSTFVSQPHSNGVACSNAVFGDPTPGVAKHCDVLVSPGAPAGYALCSSEGGTCAFPGTASVAYGANGAFKYGTYTDSVACTNAVFGDPIVGVAKSCYFKLPD